MPRCHRALPALALASLALASAGSAQPDRAGERAVTTLPIALTVATEGGAPVVSDEWLATQMRNANRLFSPHGVAFRVVERERMGPAHARLETRRDRHALGQLLHDERIDWFVVRSLRDVDDPSRYRQGVHWRPRGEGVPEGAHLVVTSAIAGAFVLAHELGHFFRNGHSDVPGNIMSYESGDGPPAFDARQGRRIRFELRRYLRSGELVPLREDAEAAP